MNKLQWNLQEIFSDNEAFYDEIEQVKKMIEDMKQFEFSELNPISLQNILDIKWKIKELTNNILIYGSLMYYKNIKDDECIKLKKIAENFNSEVDIALKFIDGKILNLGFQKVVDFTLENPKLEMYKLSLNNLFRLQKHIQTDDINQKIKENNDEINEKLNIYNNLLRNIEYENINIDGEEIEIKSSNYAKYISSRDRETRKQTYFVVNEAFQNKKNEFADLLNSIYSSRIKNYTLENYNSVLEKTLFEENINSGIIKKLIESVNKNIYLA